jgi:hypothetical protein
LDRNWTSCLLTPRSPAEEPSACIASSACSVCESNCGHEAPDVLNVLDADDVDPVVEDDEVLEFA